MEAEREAMVEKAEMEVERRMEARRRRRRWRPRRRAEMDEEMIEAETVEANPAELKREAKRAQLEMEREMDEQRREAEVAELERLLAEIESEEAEADAEEKRVEEGIRIFRVWWEQAQKQEEREDREWIKNWALRMRKMFSVTRPLALMAVWKAWRKEKLFIKLYISISEEKADQLLSNNFLNKKKVEALKESGIKVLQRELEDEELKTYCMKYIDFRNSWEDKYSNRWGQFEDISQYIYGLSYFSYLFLTTG